VSFGTEPQPSKVRSAQLTQIYISTGVIGCEYVWCTFCSVHTAVALPKWTKSFAQPSNILKFSTTVIMKRYLQSHQFPYFLSHPLLYQHSRISHFDFFSATTSTKKHTPNSQPANYKPQLQTTNYTTTKNHTTPPRCPCPFRLSA
jgi:hypothetical protein